MRCVGHDNARLWRRRRRIECARAGPILNNSTRSNVPAPSHSGIWCVCPFSLHLGHRLLPRRPQPGPLRQDPVALLRPNNATGSCRYGCRLSRTTRAGRIRSKSQNTLRGSSSKLGALYTCENDIRRTQVGKLQRSCACTLLPHVPPLWKAHAGYGRLRVRLVGNRAGTGPR